VDRLELFFSTAINYINRQTLSVLAPVISKEFHLSHSELSNIFGAFQFAYAGTWLLAASFWISSEHAWASRLLSYGGRSSVASPASRILLSPLALYDFCWELARASTGPARVRQCPNFFLNKNAERRSQFSTADRYCGAVAPYPFPGSH